MEEYMRKIIVYYKLPSKDNDLSAPELYAWTMDKGMAQNFEAQRDPSRFFKKKIVLDKYDAGSFLGANSDRKLIEDVLYDGAMDYRIICSIMESQMLNDTFDDIIDTLDELYTIFENNIHLLPKKYGKRLLEIINKASRIESLNEPNVWIGKDGEYYNSGCKINTLRLFSDLFADTFEPIKKEESYE